MSSNTELQPREKKLFGVIAISPSLYYLLIFLVLKQLYKSCEEICHLAIVMSSVDRGSLWGRSCLCPESRVEQITTGQSGSNTLIIPLSMPVVVSLSFCSFFHVVVT
jgi:hypothetical protein